MKLTQLTGVSISNAPITVFKGRHKYIYGISGAGRGFRWDGASTAVEPIGLKPPLTAATFGTTTATTTMLASVKLISGGSGYYEPPDVSFRGGGLTDGSTAHAEAVAQMRGTGVGQVVLTSVGNGYTSNPQVVFTGGRGAGAQIQVGYAGEVSACTIVARGSGYTDGASISFSGVSGAIGTVQVDDEGKISGITILNGGTNATTTATASISGSGSGAQVVCGMEYSVNALTVTSGGTGYAGRVDVQFTSLDGSGAAAYLTAGTDGALGTPVITARGQYSEPPTASVAGAEASAVAMIRPPMKGAYRCCYRYVDETPLDEGGPIPSDISDIVTVDADAGAEAFTWNWSNENADDRAAAVELFRTSANQAIILYRVALLRREDGVLPTTYVDTLSEAELIDPSREGYAYMPITLPSGQLNARRFGVPPSDLADACWFQDRAWFGVDTTGAEPNTLKYSEIDEPESVPDSNEIVIQENTGEQDAVTALIPFGSMLVVAQRRHLYRLQYVAQPVIDASITLLGYRGLLTKRCWSSFEGTVFCVDAFGMYAFDGEAMEPVSVPVDDYWRDGKIDFSQQDKFFVQADQAARVIRFHYMQAGDTGYPSRALCYCIATKAWWEEQYSGDVSAACVVRRNGQHVVAMGGADGAVYRSGVGLVDSMGGTTAGVPYELRTGNMPLTTSPDRHIGVLYQPTAATADLTLNVHYNGSTAPRPNAISDSPGAGVVSIAGGGAVVDMRASRSALGTATGYAAARFSGRVDERSAGADRHAAVAVAGTQTDAAVTLYGVTVSGVTQ